MFRPFAFHLLAMLAAPASLQNCTQWFGLQTSWGILAVVKKVMHPLFVRRTSCAAVQVAGERCAEPAFRVAVRFVPLAKASAAAVAGPRDAAQGNE